MPYSEFTLEQVEAELGVTLRQESGLFENITPVSVSPRLRETLEENLGIALASRFNARRGREDAPVYGTVTTGTLWTFLALRGTVILADPNEHSLESLETILGILCLMARLES